MNGSSRRRSSSIQMNHFRFHFFSSNHFVEHWFPILTSFFLLFVIRKYFQNVHKLCFRSFILNARSFSLYGFLFDRRRHYISHSHKKSLITPVHVNLESLQKERRKEILLVEV